jgi:hypothetical protein
MPLIKIDRLLNCSVKYLSLIILLAIIAVSLEVSSCKNVLGPTSGQSTIVFPDSNVSYYRQVLPLFEESCDYSGCHDDGTQAGGLSLTNYAGLFTVAGVLTPKDTVHSILVQRIQGIGPIMPPPPLSALNSNQIQGIKTWVMEGAPAN